MADDACMAMPDWLALKASTIAELCHEMSHVSSVVMRNAFTMGSRHLSALPLPADSVPMAQSNDTHMMADIGADAREAIIASSDGFVTGQAGI